MSYIIKKFEPELMEKITTYVNDFNKALEPDAVIVEDEAKEGIRTMAEGREGLVRLVSKIAVQHDDSLGKKDNASQLVELLEYDSSLETMRQAIKALMEYITDTQWGNSADIMVVADRFKRTLQEQRNNSAALDSAMKEVDEWNKRYGRNEKNDTDTTDTPTPSV
ncbi:hypothetical protein F0919_11065 [Taibaiella lutea]|uniref:Uncharacterized protein n=1 Tax=Taibaiella lutea TaxID=2608001 RepID=A0A5M6CMB6_9BACT|nr:hypothetical protein [Taibaiella lutea]KAA5535122.1 hypothetical protein F0919_11065 [Taibaiella lutea]